QAAENAMLNGKHVEEKPEPPQTFERRGFVRYPRRLEKLWGGLGLRARDLASAALGVFSLSRLGLLTAPAFAISTTLVIRLPPTSVGWSTHLNRVKRCVEVGPSSFQVGCTFVKPLSLAQMKMLLR